MKITKIISLILSLSMILAICIFPTHASAGTIVESWHEYDVDDPDNDIATYAQHTYEDYDTSGFISNSSDVDWWYIEFDEVGMANFYLQSPDGCNYRMSVYMHMNGSNPKLIANVTNGGIGGFDLAKIHVKPGKIYFIRVSSSLGSSADDSYLLRSKNYPDRRSYLSTIGHDTSIGTTTPLSNYCKTHINNLGFSTVNDIYNQTASQTLSQLKNADIHVIYGQANNAGIIRMQMVSGTYSFLAGVRHAALNSQSFAITDLNNGDLSETDLIIFAANKTGATSSAYGNLVDQAVNKGAYCAIGWIGDVDQLSMLVWLKGFFINANGRHLYANINVTHTYARENGVRDEHMSNLTNIYFNENNAANCYIGLEN